MENNTMRVCKWSLPIKRWGVLLFLLGNMLVTYGQYMYGTTGLLQMPSADMQRDKIFMIGGSVLAPQIIPSKEWWGNYYTFNYYINITVFPWLEIGYDCVLVKAKLGIYHWVPSTYGKFVNQDRSFHGRLRVWKESWWKDWTPQVVFGLNDPGSGSWEGGASSFDQRTNGFFCRYYVAATKHINFQQYGQLGVHVAYAWKMKRIDELKGRQRNIKGLCVGMNYQFDLPDNGTWTRSALNGLNLMAEYDSESVNVGFHYSFWKDYINAVVELNRCKYFSGGLVFKIHLK
jgi:hypothetical protein